MPNETFSAEDYCGTSCEACPDKSICEEIDVGEPEIDFQEKSNA